MSDDNVSHDTDGYANEIPSQLQDAGPESSRYRLDLNKLPQGVPFVAPLFGFSQQKLIRSITMDASRCKALVGRPLSQQEFDAISYHCAKMNAISSYGGPVGIIGGIWRAQNSKHTFRFPFWQPDYKPDMRIEEGMFDPKKFGPLRGMQAEAAWHALRRMAYALVGGSVGLALIGAYATSVAVAGQRTDIRMKDFMAVLQRMTPEERRFRIEQGGREGRNSIQSAQQGTQPSSQSMADVVNSDIQPQRYKPVPSNPGEPQPQKDEGQATLHTSNFEFDDASPRSALPPSEATSDPWERLRQNARNGVSYHNVQPSGPSSAWEQRRRNSNIGNDEELKNGSDRDETYSFSKTDEERHLAKAEAQREFDSRIERERRGQDFDS